MYIYVMKKIGNIDESILYKQQRYGIGNSIFQMYFSFPSGLSIHPGSVVVFRRCSLLFSLLFFLDIGYIFFYDGDHREPNGCKLLHRVSVSVRKP